MRRLPTFLILALSALSLRAQNVCTPDTTITGIEPDTLPAATVGRPYDEIIYFKVPTSINPFGTPMTIDSMLIDTVKGFPPTFSYQCNDSDCTYLGGEAGCIRITGMPVRADTGVHSIKVHTVVYTVINTTPTSIPQVDSLPFEVHDTAVVTGLQPFPGGAGHFYIGPNPITNRLIIQGKGIPASHVTIRIYNLVGYEVAHDAVAVSSEGTLSWQWQRPASLVPGLYFVHIRTPRRNLVRRFHIVNP